VTYPELAQLTAESIDAYFRSGVPTTHRLSATPVCELLIDPSADTYELLTPAVGAEPDLTGMQRVTVDTLALEDGTYFRLRIDARDLRYEAYGLVISVVQAMRGGASFAAATGAALTNLRTILAARRRLSPDQQTGLLGELMLVRRLLDLHAEQDVIEWWLGPMAEQHDFAFPGVDVEVKTTTAERRIHVIHGTGQLRPNPHRPLWLLSIQVTRAGSSTRYGHGWTRVVRHSCSTSSGWGGGTTTPTCIATAICCARILSPTLWTRISPRSRMSALPCRCRTQTLSVLLPTVST
jgi:hypothetical protein